MRSQAAGTRSKLKRPMAPQGSDQKRVEVGAPRKLDEANRVEVAEPNETSAPRAPMGGKSRVLNPSRLHSWDAPILPTPNLTYSFGVHWRHTAPTPLGKPQNFRRNPTSGAGNRASQALQGPEARRRPPERPPEPLPQDAACRPRARRGHLDKPAARGRRARCR